jgi:O-succinylbenzoic acid--CoA ligase
MFVSGGENIYPAVIESALMSIEDIIDATVVAVPDDDFGRRPFAFIRTDAPEADVDRIKTALREFVPGYMVPADVQPYPSSDRGLKWDRARLQSLACQIRSGA